MKKILAATLTLILGGSICTAEEPPSSEDLLSCKARIENHFKIIEEAALSRTFVDLRVFEIRLHNCDDIFMRLQGLQKMSPEEQGAYLEWRKPFVRLAYPVLEYAEPGPTRKPGPKLGTIDKLPPWQPPLPTDIKKESLLHRFLKTVRIGTTPNPTTPFGIPGRR